MYYFELKVSNTTNDFPVTIVLGEKLGNPLICELVQPFFKLLGFHRVFVHHLFEDFRRETGNPSKIEVFPFGKGISNLEISCIKQTNYIPGVCRLNHILVPGQKAVRIAEPHIPVKAHMMKIFVPFELTGADPQKGNPVPVFRVQVGMYLEDETTEFIFLYIHMAGCGIAAPGFRRNADESIQQLFYSKIIDGAAKENWRLDTA